MGKTVFLYVYGDDYSAVGFEKKYNVQEVYQSMVVEGVRHKVLEEDDYYIEVKIKEFGEVDPDFVIWIQNELCDYNQLENANIYEVKKIMELTLQDLEDCFDCAKENDFKYVAVKIQMEGFEKPEIIINSRDNFDTKLAYYKKAYNNDLTSKIFNGIKIVDFTYGDFFDGIQEYFKF